MKLTVFLLLAGIISSTHLLAEASDGTNLIKLTDSEVSSIQVIRLKGTDDSRIFRMTDGYDERIIRRVINWINTSSPRIAICNNVMSCRESRMNDKSGNSIKKKQERGTYKKTERKSSYMVYDMSGDKSIVPFEVAI